MRAWKGDRLAAAARPGFVADKEQAAAMIAWPVNSTSAAVVRTVADAHGGRALS